MSTVQLLFWLVGRPLATDYWKHAGREYVKSHKFVSGTCECACVRCLPQALCTRGRLVVWLQDNSCQPSLRCHLKECRLFIVSIIPLTLLCTEPRAHPTPASPDMRRIARNCESYASLVYRFKPLDRFHVHICVVLRPPCLNMCLHSRDLQEEVLAVKL